MGATSARHPWILRNGCQAPVLTDTRHPSCIGADGGPDLSICFQEDAVTALKLYKKYIELKSQDKLIEALNGLYDKGKACSWKTPEDDD